MTVDTYTKSGAKATTAAKLDKAVFEVASKNHELLKSAYTAYLANGRGNFAIAKTRGLVRGGGRKPWRQKGTGRARAGSSRSPIWRSGGIVFGPTGQENYQQKLHKSAKRTAVKQALSLKAGSGAVKVIENLSALDGTTKSAVKLLSKIGAGKNTLFVAVGKEELARRAVGNLPGAAVVQDKYLNVFDILNADTIVISKQSLEELRQWLDGEAKPAVKKEAKQ